MSGWAFCETVSVRMSNGRGAWREGDVSERLALAVLRRGVRGRVEVARAGGAGREGRECPRESRRVAAARTQLAVPSRPSCADSASALASTSRQP